MFEEILEAYMSYHGRGSGYTYFLTRRDSGDGQGSSYECSEVYSKIVTIRNVTYTYYHDPNCYPFKIDTWNV